MESKVLIRSIQRRHEIERSMTQRQNRAHKVLFTKRLVKAISVGLFAYITMITGQVAGWIAWPMIMWSFGCIGHAIDQFTNWRWAPWQR